MAPVFSCRILKIFLFPLIDGISWDIIKTNLLYACTFTVNYQLILTQAVKTYTILWSICIEEHIYLLFPLLMLFFNKKFKAISIFLIVAGVISWFYFSTIIPINTFSIPYFVSTSYFYYFGVGILIACMKNRSLSEKQTEKIIFKPWIQITACIIIGGYILIFGEVLDLY
jgi:peptidoglycan/LPS O-acetylase OafA/YrhL